MINAIDTHAHLDHVEDVERALEEAHQSGVVGVVAVGIDLKANKRNLEIKKATKNPKVSVALGMHPQSLEEISDEDIESNLNFIRKNISEAVAVGEIGLDFWYKWAKKNENKKNLQKSVFERQLDLAREFDLPAVIHSRGSWRDCLDLTKKAKVKRAVFHWYTGPVDVLDEILSCGYFISAGPALLYSPPLKIAIERAPIGQVLIETDCPVFYGEGASGFRAGPKDVLKALGYYTELKHMDKSQVADIFLNNSKKFFNII